MVLIVGIKLVSLEGWSEGGCYIRCDCIGMRDTTKVKNILSAIEFTRNAS